jgi:hypothetical protein
MAEAECLSEGEGDENRKQKYSQHGKHILAWCCVGNYKWSALIVF